MAAESKGGAKPAASGKEVPSPEIVQLPMPPIGALCTINFLCAMKVFDLAVACSGNAALVMVWYRHNKSIPIFHVFEKLAGLGVLPAFFTALFKYLPAMLRGQLGRMAGVAQCSPIVLLPMIITLSVRANKLTVGEGQPLASDVPELISNATWQVLVNVAMMWQASAAFWYDPDLPAAGARRPDDGPPNADLIKEAVKSGKMPSNWEIVDMIEPPTKELALLAFLFGISLIELGIDLTGDAVLLEEWSRSKASLRVLQQLQTLLCFIAFCRLVRVVCSDLPGALRGKAGRGFACAPLVMVPVVFLVLQEAGRLAAAVPPDAAALTRAHILQIVVIFVWQYLTMLVATRQNPRVIAAVPWPAACAALEAEAAAATKAAAKAANKKAD